MAGDLADAAQAPVQVHFLDVGAREYGDAVLCQIGTRSVLIDGAHPGDQVGSPGHPSIPDQLKRLLKAKKLPVTVDLLIVTHAHQDHIGCLPFLVKNGMLKATWALVADPVLGWGRDALDPDAVMLDADPRITSALAGFREEPPSPSSDLRDVAQVLVDGITLETSYKDMLAKLETDGTRLFKHRGDPHPELLQEFADIGLDVLGPSAAHLQACADAIAGRTNDARDALEQRLTGVDADLSDLELFLSLLRDETADDIDAGDKRPGPAINLQSLVTRFQLDNVNLLFAGDMQFADPQMGNATLKQELRKLRDAIQAKAPYSVVKISHHGSNNAFDASVLAELGATTQFGICAGEKSESHPNRDVLRLLNDARDRLNWVRTDHNGLSTIRLGRNVRGQPWKLTKGTIDDSIPNSGDEPVLGPAPPATAPRAVTQPPAPTRTHDPVEVITHVPAGVRRVVVTIEVDADGQVSARNADPLVLAGGRPLPDLLFVTEPNALAGNVGQVETRQAIDAIRAAGQTVHELPAGTRDAAAAIASVREQLKDDSIKGVVLVGGYDVVPSERFECLPQQLRDAIGTNNDPDDFIVWSDDSYGQRPDPAAPALPVSRVPDGRSSDLLRTVLTAGDVKRGELRRGVRNVAREFAKGIFKALPGDEPLMESGPTTTALVPELDADLVYLMLHGDDADGSRYWGEVGGQVVEAVDVTKIPDRGARVVFTGCCWGALTVDLPAQRAVLGAVPASKAVTGSIALRFLEAGATAFVGCTGAHYSPDKDPYTFFGGPLHEEFWRALIAGLAPADALLAAKSKYVLEFPHGQRAQMRHAIELKTLSQYTCLGLGW